MSYQIRVGPNPQTGILVRREKIRQKDTPGRRSHEDGDRKQSYVSTRQGTPRTTGTHRKQGQEEAWNRYSLRASRENQLH